MAELYDSYSLEKTNNEISGSFTLWQDTPTSPYDIGDTFRPFPEAPLLSVKKVNINDNVVGQVNGKLFRQWQVVIEGSTSEQTEAQETDNIKYNFEINPETKSGSMEVINKGKNPILNLTVGSKFNIPGIGKVTCTSIKGNDSYNDNGAHIWTITYEGSTTETTEEIFKLANRIEKYIIQIDAIDLLFEDSISEGTASDVGNPIASRNRAASLKRRYPL